jgi:RNA recognition motif-containing protein
MTSILDKLNFINNLQMGEVQSDHEMTVVPLIGQLRSNIAEPEALQFTRTTDYGSMEFRNTSQEKPAIIPMNMMVRGKAAQDHAMAGSGVVLAASDRLFENACCVESSQGGYFRGQEVETDVLPVDLRKALLPTEMRDQRHYGKLWGSIKTWLRKFKNFDTVSRAHLRDFFNDKDYKEALEEFAAAFEPVEGQIGALVLFNGVPVGLEIMPSSQHWEAYWKWLIRGCYGSQLIQLKESGELPRSTLVLPNLSNETPPEQVKDVLEQFVQNIRMSMAPMLEQIQISNTTEVDLIGNLRTQLLTTNGGGGGDLVMQDNEPVYLSIVL